MWYFYQRQLLLEIPYLFLISHVVVNLVLYDGTSFFLNITMFSWRFPCTSNNFTSNSKPIRWYNETLLLIIPDQFLIAHVVFDIVLQDEISFVSYYFLHVLLEEFHAPPTPVDQNQHQLGGERWNYVWQMQQRSYQKYI